MQRPREWISRSGNRLLAGLGGVVICALMWLLATPTENEKSLETSSATVREPAPLIQQRPIPREHPGVGQAQSDIDSLAGRIGLEVEEEARELRIRLVDADTGRGLPGLPFSLDGWDLEGSVELTTDARGVARAEVPVGVRRVRVDNINHLLDVVRVQPWLGGSYRDVPQENPALIEIQCTVPWAVLDIHLELPEGFQGAAIGGIGVNGTVAPPCFGDFSPGQVFPTSDRALLFFHCRPNEDVCEVVVHAWSTGKLLQSACVPLDIAPGWNRARLQLQEAPTLRVFVEDDRGVSLRESSLRCTANPGPWSTLLWEPEELLLDDGDHAWVFVLHPPIDTPLRYSVSDDRASWDVLAGTLRLEAGEERDLRLRLPAGGAPVLLAEGRVLDERGGPLAYQQVLLEFANGGSRLGSTNEDGRFEIHGLDGEELGSLRVFPFSDSLYPPARNLNLPARGVVFRRTRAPQTRSISFAIRNARDGHVIEGAILQVFAREEGDRWRQLEESFLLEGKGTLEFPFEADLELAWAATEFDYESAAGELMSKYLRASGPVLEIDLRSGFSVKYRLVDERTGRAIDGAIARDREGELLGRSSAEGVIELRASAYIDLITVEAAGYLDEYVAPLVEARWMADIPLRREAPSGVLKGR